ncbi:hypothetical protein K3X13_01195 [Aliiroseovarius crassostreae]|uniref:hypothetical protein n=1 Tax=Aliiroseovarius crassostreae TaxID=154981 RepID=UPI0022013A12|nr:hypothetical protein [Aliiroseovarius crassostreae]UWP92512.1 hypothetical protein K3X13_01195 [Aliiroseovarius crassostreae]
MNILDNDLENLFSDFPELKTDNVDFSKEVLSHFGLLFSAFGLLEAGLQNHLIFWRMHQDVQRNKKRSLEEIEKDYALLEERAFAATFGGLLKLLQDSDDIIALDEELRRIQKTRNYFAHHFFREENDKMFSDEAKLALIAAMNIARRDVKRTELAIGKATEALIDKLYPNRDWRTEVDEFMKERRSHSQEISTFRFGWNDQT